MRYGNYNGVYENGRMLRGRYSGEYGRRGVPGSGRGRYRGYGYLDDMAEQYGNYNDSKYSDSYGAEQEGEKSLEYMLKAAHQFIKMLKEEASSQEEAELVQEYARKIGDM